MSSNEAGGRVSLAETFAWRFAERTAARAGGEVIRVKLTGEVGVWSGEGAWIVFWAVIVE